ncbi:MAG: hypothetical protein GZ091_05050 [Paludibacter sp.]|nr:hypothetical protein [Paludibacter sp.]
MNKHSISIYGKTEGGVTREDLEAVAHWNDIQDYKSLIKMVSTAIAKFKEYAKELIIDQHLIDSNESDFVRM